MADMSQYEVEKEIISYLKKMPEVNEQNLNSKTDFLNGLCLDEYHLADIAEHLEKVFVIELAEDCWDLKTIGQLAEYIVSLKTSM